MKTKLLNYVINKFILNILILNVLYIYNIFTLYYNLFYHFVLRFLRN